MRNLLSTEDFTRKNLEALFSLSDDIKNNKLKYVNSLKGKIIATLFYEPSTRTRLSFESAIIQLGAKFLSTENARENSSAWKGESIEDTVRTLEGYCDAIVIRNSEEDSITKAARVSSVPIINAGNGSEEHPTQAILDLYTIKELKSTLDGISIAIMGDLKHGRTAHSLIKLLSLYNNITVYGFGIVGFELPQKYIDFLNNKNIKFIKCNSFDDIPKSIDIVYQTRVQKERMVDKTIPIKEFCIDKNALDKLSKQSYIMHPLPRGIEIHPEIDNDSRAAYFKQAHNGIFTRMALLLTIMENININEIKAI